MAGRIRESDIAEVRQRNRIDEVVGDYVALRNAGGGALKGLCPFHDEKTPSFNVRPTHGTFHCFGCGEGGDVIKFLMKIDHLGFVESVERLADRVGFRLTYEGGGGSVRRDRGTRTRMVEAHKAAAEFYVEQLSTPEAEAARTYLKERGFNETVWGKFGCGFAPSGWDRLTRHLAGRGFEVPELLKAQLVREGRRGPVDRFHRRLVWPIRDISGDVVGFGARRLFDDDQIQAKYLNTSESPIYKKSQVLFGLDLAKRDIARQHRVVVVEGYTDVMAMHASGETTAVATCGTAFGEEHMRVLRRVLMDDQWGEVIFTFDGDEAGKKAAMKAFEGEQTFTSQTYIAVTPDGIDPCDLWLAHGAQKVRDLVARRTPLIKFALERIIVDYDLNSVDGQAAALRHTVPLVAQIKDRAARDGYAVQLAHMVGWPDPEPVRARVRATASGKERATVRAGNTQRAALARPHPRDKTLEAQRELLKAALQEPGLSGPEFDTLPAEAFTHPAYVAVFHAILKVGGTANGLSGPGLIDTVAEHAPDGVPRSLVSELAVEPLRAKREVDVRYISSVLAAVRENLVARQVTDIKGRLQRLSPLDAPDDYKALFGDLVALEEYRKALREQAIGGMD